MGRNNTDGNLDALNRYEKQMERNERDTKIAIESFRAMMDDAVEHLVSEFNRISKHSDINRNELRAILLEDVEAQL